MGESREDSRNKKEACRDSQPVLQGERGGVSSASGISRAQGKLSVQMRKLETRLRPLLVNCDRVMSNTDTPAKAIINQNR